MIHAILDEYAQGITLRLTSRRRGVSQGEDESSAPKPRHSRFDVCGK